MTSAPVLTAAPNALDQADVVIVGGGPAGLSAALVLGRARRSVVVVDAGDPAHFVADAVHGFLGMEGVPPRELRARVWEQLAPFDVTRIDDRVLTARSVPAGDGLPEFALGLAGGGALRASAVLLAGGLRYGVQPVPGLAELWGTRVFHCPFCHGWEARGQRIAAIAPAPAVAHYGPLLSLWSDAVQPFVAPGGGGEAADGAASAGSSDAARASSGDAAAVVPVAARVRLEGDDVVVTDTDGGEHHVDAIFAAPILSAPDDLAEQLGLARDPGLIPALMAPQPTAIATGPWGVTAVPGVFAAGDPTTAGPSVALAVASGSMAATSVVRGIATGELRAARAAAPVRQA